MNWWFLNVSGTVCKKTARSTSTLKLSDPQLVIEGESEQEDEAQNDS